MRWWLRISLKARESAYFFKSVIERDTMLSCVFQYPQAHHHSKKEEMMEELAEEEEEEEEAEQVIP